MSRIKFLIFFIVIFLIYNAWADQSKQSICLNMIVKNESRVIERCLESVKSIIDYWVIVDTGSSDGTQEIIKEFMKDIPGKLHEYPWVNFEHNRNVALDFAKNKGDYVLSMDADEHLVFSKNFMMPVLDNDYYFFELQYGGMKYYRVHMVNNHLHWRWEDVLHEHVECKEAKTSKVLEGVINEVKVEGCRSQDPQKYQNDAKVLEEALKKDPNNKRYVFYLAQSYRDCNENLSSIENYEKRVKMGGWNQEVYFSLYQIARLQEISGMDPEVFLDSYYKTYSYRPTRIEPLYYLANYYRRIGSYYLGYTIANLALFQPKSKDGLFVEEWIYNYGLLWELSICAFEIEKYVECRDISNKILRNKNLPQHVKSNAENNLKLANAKIKEKNLFEIKEQKTAEKDFKYRETIIFFSCSG